MPGALSLGNINLFKLSSRKAAIKLQRLKPEDDKPDRSALALQYWPESLNDTAASNYVKKTVPGGSLPLYQWVNGSERSITFQALFTTDVDLTKWASTQPATNVDEGFIQELKQKGLAGRNIDIRSALIWLRSFRMPTYKSDGTYLPPPKCVLTIPGSMIGLWSGDYGSGHDTDSIVCVMTQCEIEIRASFPNGVPRVAAVSLGFEEIPQLGGLVQFPGYTPRIADKFQQGTANGASDGAAAYGSLESNGRGAGIP